MMKRELLFVWFCPFLLGVTIVSGETTDCDPITALPATIDTQGIYCLVGNLSTAITSGTAITINANNVTLDLNGWKVGGQAAGMGTQTWGIFSSANNITVRNGIVRGFSIGVYLTGRGALIEDLMIDQNTVSGINSHGNAAVIRRNRVVDTGGSTSGSDVTVHGITVYGPDSLVDNNHVSGLTATGDGLEWAIIVAGIASHSTVRGNVIVDDVRPPGAGISTGIGILTENVSVVGNVVTDFDRCVFYDAGITGLYAQNATIDCGTKYSGGTSGSDND
jgi:hypothetical protein